MTNNLKARFAGIACLAGGLLFFLDFAVVGWAMKTHFLSHPTGAVNLLRSILWCTASLGLAGGGVGLTWLGVTGTGWKRKLGFCGTVWSLLGAASYIVGSIYIYNFPDYATRQFFTPLGSILLTLGTLKLAVAALSAGAWQDWRRFVPLLVALYFPLQLPVQIVFFLGQGKGPNPLLLGAWGLFWALLGAVIWAGVPPSASSLRFAAEKV